MVVTNLLYSCRVTYSALGNPNTFSTISSHFAVLCSESQLLMDTFFP